MTSQRSGRALRLEILNCIKNPDPEKAIRELGQRAGARRLIRPLMSLIRSQDDVIKYPAVAALGWLTAELAETDLETARNVVRRLMLTLTEESGGIGWGSPEAIGEILARHEGLAQEFTDILVSYARDEEDSNYLGHEPLQRGVFWGLSRLAEIRPQLLMEKGIVDCLRSHLESTDAIVRGLAAYTARLLGIAEHSCPEWNRVLKDTDTVTVCMDGKMITCRVQDLAKGPID